MILESKYPHRVHTARIFDTRFIFELIGSNLLFCRYPVHSVVIVKVQNINKISVLFLVFFRKRQDPTICRIEMFGIEKRTNFSKNFLGSSM